MNRADFTVGDKYRAKYDELGKTTSAMQANTFELLQFSKSLRFSQNSLVFDIWTNLIILPYLLDGKIL